MYWQGPADSALRRDADPTTPDKRSLLRRRLNLNIVRLRPRLVCGPCLLIRRCPWLRQNSSVDRSNSSARCQSLGRGLWNNEEAAALERMNVQLQDHSRAVLDL